MSYNGRNPPYYISAYGLARKMGFEGTEEEWLNSLTAFYMAQKAGFAGTSEEWVQKLVDPLPEFAIGQVVTLEGGSMATVQITGTKEKPVLNFGIPRGVGMADALPLVGGTMKGSINMQNFSIKNLPAPVNDEDAAPKNYVDKNRQEMTEKTDKKLAEKLALSGGTMTGDINMNDRNLYNLKTPVQDADAAHKKYVDDSMDNAISEAAKNAKTKTIYCTLTAEGWSATEPFTQDVAIENLTDELQAKAYPVFPAGLAEKLALGEETAKVRNCTRSGNVMTFECWEDKPALDIPIAVEVYV